MPITKKLVEKMGGSIAFESKVGEGTTFVIRIPFQIDTDRNDRAEAEEKQKPLSVACISFWWKIMN